MKKILVFATMMVALLSMNSCVTRIDQGHVGLKIDLAGSKKGQGVTEVSGWVWYMPGASIVEEFPTFTQTADYDDFVVTTKDAAQFHVDPTLNYSAISDSVPHIYKQYRKPLEVLQSSILRNIVFDAYRITANSYTSDSIMSNRGQFENEVEAKLTKTLLEDGFRFERITSNLKPPASLQSVIDAKNTAIQTALKAENEVKTAEANAKIAVAQAEGEANAKVASAKGEYEAAKFQAAANRELQSSYTTNFVQMRWIEAWEKGGSQVPTYQLGSNAQFLMNMPGK